MTLSTKVLIALVLVLAAGSVFADVTAKDVDEAKFSATPTVSKSDSAEVPEPTVGEEVAANQTEAGSCTVSCHPAMPAVKSALAHIDLSKIH